MVAATQYPESMIIKGLAHIPIPAFHRTWGGVILRFGMAIGLVAGLYLLFHYGLEPYMPAVDDYIRNLGAWGPVLFMLAVILGATLGFPESVLALAAGAVFGIWWGFATSLDSDLCRQVSTFDPQQGSIEQKGRFELQGH